MAERRSLANAMEMTPAKMAFIKGQEADRAMPQAAASAANTSDEKTIELGTPGTESEAQKEPRSRASQRSARSRSQQGPEASELLDQVLVPVTIRLQHRIAQALRRANLEQRLKHAKPDTQQDIAEEALTNWLIRSGYLD